MTNGGHHDDPKPEVSKSGVKKCAVAKKSKAGKPSRSTAR
jgi:hypothetical protein